MSLTVRASVLSIKLMPVQHVFSSQIYKAPCLKKQASLFGALRKECRQIEAADGEGQAWSRQAYAGGYTSYGSWDQLHRMSPHFEELKNRIDRHVRIFLKDLAWDVRAQDIQMSRFWVNVMGPGSRHSMHLHPLSVLSGTFYLEVPDQLTPLKFEDPRLSHFMARPPLKSSAPRDQQNFLTVQPKAGDVVLFESWMRHEVPPQKVVKPRISMSFNYDWVSR